MAGQGTSGDAEGTAVKSPFCGHTSSLCPLWESLEDIISILEEEVWTPLFLYFRVGGGGVVIRPVQDVMYRARGEQAEGTGGSRQQG